MAGMHQFLAQPALIHRILVFNRHRRGCSLVRGLGRGLGKLRVDMGLDRQALEEEAQKHKHSQPLARGYGWSGGVLGTRHG